MSHLYKDSDVVLLYESQTPSQLYTLNASTGVPYDSITVGDNSEGQFYGMAHVVGDFTMNNDSLEFTVFSDDNIITFTAGGVELWRKDVSPLSSAYNGGSSFGSADIEGDGDTELVLARRGVLYVLDSSTGETEWSAQIGAPEQSIIIHQIVLLDDSTDGDLDILVNGYNSDMHKLYLYESSGTKLWECNIERDAEFAVGDIDVDGDLEIVVASGSRLRVLTTTGSIVDSLSLDNGTFNAVPLLVDIDEDSDVEIVTFTTYDDDPDTMYVYSEAVKDYGVIRIYDDQLNAVGDTLPFFAIATASGAKPVISDIDGDGDAEIAFVSSDSTLHVLELGSHCDRKEWSRGYKNEMNTNVYAQPVWGEYNNSVSLFNRVHVIGDATFREDVYVGPGTDVRIWRNDLAEEGVDSLRIELHAYKEFKVMGTEKQPVQFAAWSYQGFSNDTDDWWGIDVNDGSSSATGLFDYCSIRNGLRAVRSSADITISNCTIENCDLIGIEIAGADTAFVFNTTIRDVELSGIKITGTSTVQVTSCTIENVEDYGIEMHSGATLHAKRNTIRGCDRGVFVSIGDTLNVTADIDSCEFYSNDTGIWIYEADDVDVANCVIDTSETK